MRHFRAKSQHLDTLVSGPRKKNLLPPSCSTCPSQLDTVIRSQLSCTAYTVVASVLVVRTVGAPLKKTGISSSYTLFTLFFPFSPPHATKRSV